MNIKLQSADSFSQSMGAKIVIFGPPKRGKTSLLKTLSNGVLLSTDYGLRSMRGSDLPCHQASTVKDVEDFFSWLASSSEAKQYNTVAIDDITALAAVYLNEGSEQKSSSGKKRHGQELYGHMATEVLKFMRFLKFRPQTNVVILGKEVSEGPKKKLWLPGNVLPIEIPHLFDEIMYLDRVNFGANGGEQLCLYTKESNEIGAGTRTPLDVYEPANLDYIITKILNT